MEKLEKLEYCLFFEKRLEKLEKSIVFFMPKAGKAGKMFFNYYYNYYNFINCDGSCENRQCGFFFSSSATCGKQ